MWGCSYVAQWVKYPRCHWCGSGYCCGVGSIPGLGTSAYLGCNKKKNPYYTNEKSLEWCQEFSISPYFNSVLFRIIIGFYFSEWNQQSNSKINLRSKSKIKEIQRGSSRIGTAEMNLTRNHEVAGSILAWLNGLRIRRCRELWCRLQMHLGSLVAVALG